jgi:hypothetical protein
VLELVEEALDEIALAVDVAVDRSVDEPLAGRGDVSFGAGGADQVEQAVGVIAAIGHDMAAFQAGQQWARMMELSIKAIEPGDLAAKVSNTCTQTPARAHRLKRL